MMVVDRMITFFGIVEDRHDPMQIGRVRVRCHGIHTDDKSKIATPDLPWAQVLLPTTSASISGFGTQHGLVEGSTVYGFFRDGATKQDPVITHSAAGIPSEFYIKDKEGKLHERSVSKGFNDPRRPLSGDYDGTPDQKTPQQSPQRPHGLTHSLHDAPCEPDNVVIKYSGEGSWINTLTPSKSDLPFYPLKARLGQSDLSPYARGERVGGAGGKNIYTGPVTSVGGYTSPAEPKYPYNKVLHSESGHVLEVDDTPDKERLSWWHRSGSFMEVGPDGTMATRVVNDNYSIICGHDEVYIGGNVIVHVEGNANINVLGNMSADVGGRANVKASKDMALFVGEDADQGTLSIEATKEIVITSKTVSITGDELNWNS